MKKPIAVVFCLVLFACATRHSQDVEPVILSAEILQAWKNSESELQQSRLALTFTSGEFAEDCTSYFRLKEVGDITDGVNNMIAAQDYVLCDTLRNLGSATSTFTGSNISARGKALAERLALNSFPSSAFQKTEDNKNTAHTVFTESLELSENALSVESDDWLYRIEVVAIADFNGNKQEDWLVWLTDKAKVGNYSVLKAFVIYDVSASAFWVLNEV